MWVWSPKLRGLAEALQMPFEVVDIIPGEMFGSSPGDAVWTGEKMILERGAWEPWVAHEIAHHIAATVLRPNKVCLWNWGIGDLFTEGDEKAKGEEGVASELTVVLLALLGLPWVEAYRQLNINGSGDEGWEDDRVELHLDASVRISKKYLDWLKEQGISLSELRQMDVPSEPKQKISVESSSSSMPQG